MYIKATAKSKALMRGADFHVILPYHDGYPDAKRPYPTLYFLPGFSASAEEIVFALPLRQMSALYGVAIVVPDGENAFYTDHPDRAFRMGEYAGKELVEITRKMFPCLSHEREDTFIGGISMGGYGALYNGLRFRNTFSKIIALSPSVSLYDLICGHDFMFPAGVFTNVCGSREDYLASELNLDRFYAEVPKEEIPELYLCCGQQDGLVVDAVNRFVGVLDRRGVPYIYRKGDGNHELDYWERHLDDAFSFLAGIEPGTKNRLVLGDFG